VKRFIQKRRTMPRLAPVIKIVLFRNVHVVPLLNRDVAVLNSTSAQSQNAKRQADVERSLIRLRATNHFARDTILGLSTVWVDILAVPSPRLLFLRDNFTANDVSPPAEVALTTISPTLAIQHGHDTSPLSQVAKHDC
jgi:hypothetical protein